MGLFEPNSILSTLPNRFGRRTVKASMELSAQPILFLWFLAIERIRLELESLVYVSLKPLSFPEFGAHFAWET
jgi:hypothetical protein